MEPPKKEENVFLAIENTSYVAFILSHLPKKWL